MTRMTRVTRTWRYSPIADPPKQAAFSLKCAGFMYRPMAFLSSSSFSFLFTHLVHRPTTSSLGVPDLLSTSIGSSRGSCPVDLRASTIGTK